MYIHCRISYSFDRTESFYTTAANYYNELVRSIENYIPPYY